MLKVTYNAYATTISNRSVRPGMVFSGDINGLKGTFMIVGVDHGVVNLADPRMFRFDEVLIKDFVELDAELIIKGKVK